MYASTGALGQTVLPVEEKEALVDALRDAVDEIRRFCQARDVDLDHITTLRRFEWVEALKDVSDQLMLSDEETSSFLERATRVERLFKAILPDDRANEFAPIRKVIRVVMDRIGEAGPRVFCEEALLGNARGTTQQAERTACNMGKHPV